MPFKSKAQQRFMFAKHPQMAEEFAEATPDIKKLPEHVKKMADGGEVFNPPQGDFEAIKAALLKNSGPNEGEPGMEDATVPDFVAPMLGTKAANLAMPEISAAMKGLGEAGEFTLGKAPEMEGMAPKIEVFSKGVMGKGTPNQMTIWGVKGDPEAIARLGYGPDPASIPEHVLKQHGLLPETSVQIPQNAPNGYSEGGEVMDNIKKFFGGDKKEAQKADDIDPVVHTSTETPKGYALGGPVTSAALNMLGASGIPGLGDIGLLQDMQQAVPAISQAMAPPPPPTPPIPPMSEAPNVGPVGPGPQYMDVPPSPSLSQAAQTAQQVPATDYNLYKGISADDRANLYKQLLAQKASGANLAVKGVAGLGDAISNAFGRGGQNTLGGIRESENQNIQNQVGAVDTQRQQKIQDIQGSIALQEADPSSPYSKGMRQFLISQGMKVPSGMSAAMLKQTLPDVTKIFDSHLQAATQAGAQGLEAGKALMGESLWQDFKSSMGLAPEKAESYLENRIGANAPASSNGWKVVR